jgi:excisionase family DNA binding protein
MEMYQGKLDATPAGREWITAAEAASILGVSIEFIKKRIKNGQIKSQLLGHQHRIPKKDFAIYFKQPKL